MKPIIRVHVEFFEGSDKRTLFIDIKELPVGMTPKRCAVWMLNRAMERLAEQQGEKVRVVD